MSKGDVRCFANALPRKNTGTFTSSAAWDLYPVSGLQLKMLDGCEKVRVQPDGPPNTNTCFAQLPTSNICQLPTH